MNIGFFYRKKPTIEGCLAPEFYTLPNDFIRSNHHIVESGWEKVKTKNIDIDQYKNEKGFELIAKELGVEYPSRDKG